MKMMKCLVGLVGIGLSVAVMAAPAQSLNDLLGMNQGVCPTGTMGGCKKACNQQTGFGRATCLALCEENCPR